MSTASMVHTCAVCGAEESLDSLLHRVIDDDLSRRLIADILCISLPLGGQVVSYLRLHKPLKQALRLSKVQQLLAELAPDMQRGLIQRKGRDWKVSHDLWRDAFAAVFEARDKGTLTLPLDGNGYLYQVVMRLADQAEAAQEREREAGKRSRVHTAEVRPAGHSAFDAAVQRYERGEMTSQQQPARRPAPMAAPAPSAGPSPAAQRIKDDIARRKGLIASPPQTTTPTDPQE